MTQYVFSTITNTTCYCHYETSPHHMPVLKKKVEIRGGHGVNAAHNPKQKTNFYTPKGIVTAVSDEDMDFLLSNESFQRHIKSGFITYDKRDVNPEKKVINMNKKDGSAPLTPEDYEKGDRIEERTTYKTRVGVK